MTSFIFFFKWIVNSLGRTDCIDILFIYNGLKEDFTPNKNVIFIFSSTIRYPFRFFPLCLYFTMVLILLFYFVFDL